MLQWYRPGRDNAPYLSVRGVALRIIPATTYSPRGFPPSTIGAGGLNFRVRDGNGCDSAAMATGNLVKNRPSSPVSVP